MPFVKLDCGILRSTLWFEKDQRDVFLASLLLAEPREFTEPVPEIKIRSLELTGWAAPPGWYGFVPAASVGICDCAKIEFAKGLNALERLASPEAVSRSADFEGRRMIRIDGGFLILNFQKYRDRDYTTAERSARYRTRKQQLEERSSRRDTVTPRRDITQAEAEVRSQKSETIPERRTSRRRWEVRLNSSQGQPNQPNSQRNVRAIRSSMPWRRPADRIHGR